jgi:DNA-binding Lrp family transcriptional regulator
VTAPDPVDIRLLTVLAETGRAAVHEIAMRLNMDTREVAARLAALSTTGLPLVVGAECDPQGIRAALAAAAAWQQQQAAAYYPPQRPNSGPYPVYGSPNSGPYPTQSGPSGPVPYMPPYPNRSAPAMAGTWTPPAPAAWTRPDHAPTQQVSSARTGKVGTRFDIDGPGGERITLQLIEVVDPADYLFSATGHNLAEGERSVVVHTELTNRGQVPFTAVPDLGLVLVASDGSIITKSARTLSSRPPHRAGVPPGETAGGHTVYVLPETTPVVEVRWMPGPGGEGVALTWDISDL